MVGMRQDEDRVLRPLRRWGFAGGWAQPEHGWWLVDHGSWLMARGSWLASLATGQPLFQGGPGAGLFLLQLIKAPSAEAGSRFIPLQPHCGGGAGKSMYTDTRSTSMDTHGVQAASSTGASPPDGDGCPAAGGAAPPVPIHRCARTGRQNLLVQPCRSLMMGLQRKQGQGARAQPPGAPAPGAGAGTAPGKGADLGFNRGFGWGSIGCGWAPALSWLSPVSPVA